MTQQKKQLVIVGLSGGVDSSVAAALLVQQGYRVIGVFMKNWSDNTQGCCNTNADLA
ncbi:MAG: tRNA 2-thiouridine(34) synthase MnmA, partial [bacterium]